MVRQTQELRADTRQEQGFNEGLLSAASLIRDDPRRRETLEMFVNGDIHKQFGGEIVTPRGPDLPPIVYWHDHGTFVGPDGSIYHARTDDYDEHRQMFVSPADERGRYIRCIQPFTYDGYTGPHSIEMRFDFINGPHRAAPRNTLEEAELQRREGLDPVYPRHKEWVDERRDSLSLVKDKDGHIDGWLHDSVTNQTHQLYDPVQVLETMRMLDELEREVAALTAEQAKDRQRLVAEQLGRKTVYVSQYDTAA